MLKFIIDDKIPFIKGVFEPYASVEYVKGADINANTIKNANALIIRTRTKCNAQLLDNSKVEIICTATAGFDHIDIDYCNKNNIAVHSAPGCNSESVKQYVAAALAKLSIEKQMPLHEMCMGVIGVGNVGSKVANFAQSIGMKVLRNDPPLSENENSETFADIEQIKKDADIISFHVPLIAKGKYKTENMCNASFIDECKKGVVVINSSRGEVCNNIDLLEAYRDEQIQHLIIDVWQNEPNINKELLKNCFISTSHIAGYSADGKAKGTQSSVNNIAKHFKLPINNWKVSEQNKDIDFTINLNVSDKEIWQHAVLATYNIDIDNSLLKNEPENFEKHRGNYMVRREFFNYNIHLNKHNKEVSKILSDIGFN